MNDKHSLKCPVSRAEHKLGEEGAKLLPVNSYACQELPQKRLSQKMEKKEIKPETGKKMTKSVNLVVKPSLLMWHGALNAASFVNPVSVMQCTRRWHV